MINYQFYEGIKEGGKYVQETNKGGGGGGKLVKDHQIK